jgi:membrane protease YdiL (CAAX protease family)
VLYAITTGLLSGAEWDVATGFLFYILIGFWIIRNFNREGVNYQKFIGHIPYNYNWIFLFSIIFAVIILSLGLGELSRYLISLINPNLLNHLPNTSVFFTPSETPFAPFLNFMEFIIVVFMAPIVEEFLFRGVLLHRFTIKWGVKWAILISSIIFAVLHSDIIGAFTFALVMCILYIKTASILVPILAHMVNNLLAYGMEILSTFSPQSTVASHNLTIAVLLLLLSIMIISYFLYRNWPQRYWRPPYFQEVYDGIPENLYYD